MRLCDTYAIMAFKRFENIYKLSCSSSAALSWKFKEVHDITQDRSQA